MSQRKTIHSQAGETVRVDNQLAALAESRGTTVASVAWEVCGGLELGATSLAGTLASASVAVNGCGTVTCTATLANGEVRKVWRMVEARGSV